MHPDYACVHRQRACARDCKRLESLSIIPDGTYSRLPRHTILIPKKMPFRFPHFFCPQVMNGMNGHDDLEKNKNALANSASFYQPALILLAGVSSFVSLIMVMALVIVTASTNPDCNAKVNNVLNASSVPSKTMDTCPSSAQPFPASGLDMVAMAYNNMGKDMLNGKADYRYQGLADQLKPIGWHQEMLCEASDAGDRTELVADGMSGDVDFPHSSFQPILTIGIAPGPPRVLCPVPLYRMMNTSFGKHDPHARAYE